MRATNNPVFSIVVLCFNHLEETTKPCLESLLHSYNEVSFEVIVVDNNSGDDTKNFLIDFRNKNPKLDIQLILNNTNKGFSGGNNDGIIAAKGEYIVLLNNDTLVPDLWLDKFYNHFQKNKTCGLVAPLTNYAGTEQKIIIDGLGEDNFQVSFKAYEELNKRNFFYTDRLSFFCVAFPKKIVSEVGLLDPAYSIGMFEDDDYCQRVIDNGYSINVLKDCFIFHKGSSTFKHLSSKSYTDLFNKNRVIFRDKFERDWTFTDVAVRYFEFLKTQMLETQDFDLFKQEFLMRSNDIASLLNLIRDREIKFINAPDNIVVNHSAFNIFVVKLKSFYSEIARITKLFLNEIRFFIKKLSFSIRAFGIKKSDVPYSESIQAVISPVDKTSIIKKIDVSVIDGVNYLLFKSLKNVKYTIISTVFNEADNINKFMTSILSQTCKADEIIIVDAGSNDGTYEILMSIKAKNDNFNITVIQRDRCNVPEGRNIAIKQSSNELIVLMDAGSRVNKNYCKELLYPMTRDSSIDLVAGITLPDSNFPSSWIANKDNYINYDFTEFLPSARAAVIRKSIYKKIDGGFPEHLKVGEDTLFMIYYRNFSSKWLINKSAIVKWKNPNNLIDLNKLKQKYAFGDGESGFGDWNLDFMRRSLFRMTSYLQGKLNRPIIEKTRGILDVDIIVSIKPFESLGNEDETLAKELVNKKHKVIYIQDTYSDPKHPIKFIDYDFTLLEISLIDIFDIDDFCCSYGDFNVTIHDKLNNLKSLKIINNVRKKCLNVKIAN